MVLSKDKHGDGMFSKTMTVTTKVSMDTSEETTNLERLASIGPPKNVSVHLTMEGYLVTWEPPEYGKELLNVYRLKWSDNSKMDTLCGTVETTDLFFNGK